VRRLARGLLHASRPDPAHVSAAIDESLSVQEHIRMAAITAASSASDIQMDYMKLLVTQLQNQNPLEPLDNKDMAAQLAQFSQLQQMENLNGSFSRVLESVQRSYASSLIGKDVSFKVTAQDGSTATKTGQVEEVSIEDDGDIILTVDDQQVNLTDVTSIRD